jgi:pyrroloquinoline quinone (PQQ) biosynthesis protein C
MSKTNSDFEPRLRALLEELRPYALAYYHPLVNGEAKTRDEVAAFFRSFYIKDTGVLLARTYTKCPHLEARRFIAENLFEEEGKGRAGRSHAELSLRLAAHFGADREQSEAAYSDWAASDQSRARDEMVAREDWLEEFAGFGLGAEYFAPPLFEMIVECLRDEFKLPEETLEFFLVHLYEDIDHADRTLEMVMRYASTEAEHEKVIRAIRRHVLGEAGDMGEVRTPTPLSAAIVDELRRRARAHGQAIPDAVG